jgi:threonine aldolase
MLPALLPVQSLLASTEGYKELPPDATIVNFFDDGKMYTPEEYIRELQEIYTKTAFKRDYYGQGGVVAALEKRFQEITGKEKAVFMPTGTMANQLAISVLSGDNTKVFVQDTSHVYRDEADSAQSIHGKRLMPLAKGQTYFTAAELKLAIESLKDEEVFASGIGAVSIENPVRRTEGRLIPLDEIRKISEYCRAGNIALHLDGARLYMAAAWSGVSIKEYSTPFDTVYISMYKYLGAQGGAILCGEKKVIDKMEHLVKVHGGTLFGNWTNAAMALHRLDGIEKRLQDTIRNWEQLTAKLHKLSNIKISALDNGTNIYTLQLGNDIDANKLRNTLNTQFNVRIPRADNTNKIMLTVNETILYRDIDYLANAFGQAMTGAKKT